MRDALPEIRRRGAELVVIGSGRPWHAKAFREEQGVDFLLLTDPELQAYGAAQLQRRATAVVNLRAVGAAIRAWREGHRQSATKGDPWQNGGVFVIAPPDRVLYEQRSDAAGDHAPLDDVLAALPPARQ